MSKSSSIIAAAVQLQPADSIAENLANAAKWIACAVSDGAQLVVLPENFAHLGRRTSPKSGWRRAASLVSCDIFWLIKPPSTLFGWSVARCQ